MAEILEKFVAAHFVIPGIDKANPESYKTGETLADTAYTKIGAGAWTTAAIADTFSEIGTTGMYEISLTAGEMNFDQMIIKTSSANTQDNAINIIMIPSPSNMIEIEGSTVIAGRLNDFLVNGYDTTTNKIFGISSIPGSMVTTKIAVLSTQTSFTLSAGSADDDAYNGNVIVISKAGSEERKAIGIVQDYVGSTKTITLFNDPGIYVMGNNDIIEIVSDMSLKPTAINRTLDVTATGAAGIDWGNVENKGTANDLSGTDIQLVDTTTTNSDMVGTDNAALASVCTEGRLAELDAANLPADIDAILLDTGTTLDTKLNDIQGATFSSATDSLEAIRDRGDAAWTTGAGTGLSALASGTAQAGAASTITLAAGESATDDIYNGSRILTTGGTGSGQSRLVIDYDGGTKIATVARAWTTNPASGTTYEVQAAESNLETIQTDEQSVTDLKDLADAGYDPATNKIQGLVLCDTTTTNSDMVGTDNAALASVCTEGRLSELDAANLPSDIDAILADVTGINGDAMRGTNDALLAASAPTNFGDLAITVTNGRVTVGTNNDKTGYTLTSADQDAIVDKVWNELQSGHTTAGTFGKFLDVEVSSVSGGGGLTQQNVRDAMKLAPTGGVPSAGSVDEHLDDILTDTGETQTKLPTNNIMGSGVKTNKDDEIDNTNTTVGTIDTGVGNIVAKLPTKSTLAGTTNVDGDVELQDATGSLAAGAYSNHPNVDLNADQSGVTILQVNQLGTQAKLDVNNEVNNIIYVKQNPQIAQSTPPDTEPIAATLARVRVPLVFKGVNDGNFKRFFNSAGVEIFKKEISSKNPYIEEKAVVGV